MEEKKPQINHDRVIANQVSGMSWEEAIFQDGYSAGVEFEQKREKRGAVWIKAITKLPTPGKITWRWLDKAEAYSGYDEKRGFIYGTGGASVDPTYYSEIEWLDESGTAAPISQDAHEKEIMIQAFDKVRRLFEGRQWIMEGRGSYPYNDDRYKEEVRHLYDEFDQVFKDTMGNIRSKSIDYRKAIIAEYVNYRLEGTAAGREEDAVSKEVIDFIRDIAQNWDCDEDGHKYNTGCRKCSASELYFELSKQQKEK